jgi:3-deoxy-7-phosphoheptulonate synthase
MVVVMKVGASEAHVETVIEKLSARGFDVLRTSGQQQSILCAIGVKRDSELRQFRILDGVAEVHRITTPYKLAGRTWKKDNSVVNVGEVAVGGADVVLIAGSSGIIDSSGMELAANELEKSGILLAVTGGIAPAQAESVSRSAAGHGVRLIAEITDAADVESFDRLVSAFHITAGNMQNESLLRAAGNTETPVILTRNSLATVSEWLLSAEIMLSTGNPNIILCEGASPAFASRTIDIALIPETKANSHLPLIVDTTGISGGKNYQASLARAAVAAGVDGLIVAVESDDGERDDVESGARTGRLADELNLIARAIGRSLQGA